MLRTCHVTRRCLLVSLLALWVAGCGASQPSSDSPPGAQHVTLYVKEMSARLKLM
jgi:hypothetical protein